MFISTTLVILYVLTRPIIESIDALHSWEVSDFPQAVLYIAAFFVALECLKTAYGWGKVIEYNAVPEATVPGELIGSGVVFTITMGAYIFFVSNFIVDSTHKAIIWTFLKYYAQLVLFFYFLYRVCKTGQWLYELGMKLVNAPNTVNKSNLMNLCAAAILFHCQMIIHESYSWGTIATLCFVSAVSLLCFDVLSNFNYILQCAERSLMVVSCNTIFRSALLFYCYICDRVRSSLLREKTYDQGYPAYSFL